MSRNFDIPRTEGLTWVEWCAAFINSNPTVIGVPQPMPVEQWQLWASEICSISELLGRTLPWPHGYARWEDWTQRLTQALVGSI